MFYVVYNTGACQLSLSRNALECSKFEPCGKGFHVEHQICLERQTAPCQMRISAAIAQLCLHSAMLSTVNQGSSDPRGLIGLGKLTPIKSQVLLMQWQVK